MKMIRTYLIGIVVFLMSFTVIGQLGVSTARGPEKSPTPTAEPTETGQPEGIQFLDTGDLSFNYKDLINNQKIQMGVLNNSAKTLSIMGEILVLNTLEISPIMEPTSPSDSDTTQQATDSSKPTPTLTPTPTPFPPPITLVFTPTASSQPLEPGKIMLFKFELDTTASPTPEKGTYRGFIIIRALDGDNKLVSLIQRPFTLYVPEKPSEPTSVDGSKIESISEKENLSYDLRDLKAGKKQISVLIKNEDVSTATVNVKFPFPGRQTQLYEEKTGLSLPPGQTTLLTFCHTPDNNSRNGSENQNGTQPASNINQSTPPPAQTVMPTPTPGPEECIPLGSPPELDPGEYNSFITLEFKSAGETIKIESIPITLTVSSSETLVDQIANLFQTLSQERFRFKLGTVEWVILAVILLILLRYTVRLYWRWRGKPGTVEITLTDQSGEDLKPEAEQAVMEERLAQAGLLPPSSVPGDSIGENIISGLETNQVIPTRWVATLIRLFWRILLNKPGHLVNGTLLARERKPEKGLIIEITDVRTGKIEPIEPFWKDTHQEATTSAAYFIYQHVTSRPHVIRKIPVWARFHSATAFEQYQHGQLLQEEGKYEEARKVYLDTAAADPNNTLVRFRLGNLMESQPSFKFLDALEAYLEILFIWPDLPEARYRLAATFSFDKKLVAEWKKENADRRKNLLALIHSVIGDEGGPKSNIEKLIEWYRRNIESKLISELDKAIEKDKGWDILSLLELAQDKDFSAIGSAIITAYNALRKDASPNEKKKLIGKLRRVNYEAGRLFGLDIAAGKENLKNLLTLAYIAKYAKCPDQIILEAWDNLPEDLKSELEFAIANESGWNILSLLEGAEISKDFFSIKTTIKDAYKSLDKIQQDELKTKKLQELDREVSRLSKFNNPQDLKNAKENLSQLLKLTMLINFGLSDYFLELACNQWCELLRDIKVWPNIRRFLRLYPFILFPGNWSPENGYWRKFTWPSGKIKQFKKASKSAKYGTELRKSKQIDLEKKIDLEKEIEKLLRIRWYERWLPSSFVQWSSGIDWQVRYNAVCFYAIAMGIIDDRLEENGVNRDSLKQRREGFEKKALKQLEMIIKDPVPKSRMPRAWLRENDPDLEALQNTSGFKTLVGVAEEPAKTPEELCHSWDVLAAAAKHQEDVWYNRWVTVRALDDDDLTPDEIGPWWEEELELWEALRVLAFTADGDSKRTAFWTSVKKYHPGAGEMPMLAMKCNEGNCKDYEKSWSDLHDCAFKRVEQLTKENTSAMTHWQREKWVQQQWLLWHALRSWAGNPLERALVWRFKKKGNCS